MYAEAFFEKDVHKLINAGLKCIPQQSMYAGMVRDVVKWHAQNPKNWEKTWELIVEKYRKDKNYHVSPLDVKQEGALALMGMLYGNRDPDQTIIISMRGGADSDCNPSTAAGILFTSIGLSKLPDRYHKKLDEAKIFSYTAYNFPGLMAVCERLARQALAKAGGRVERKGGEEIFVIPVKTPVPSPFEDIKNPGPIANSVFTPEERALITVQDPPRRQAAPPKPN
jgi:hypothetical protein